MASPRRRTGVRDAHALSGLPSVARRRTGARDAHILSSLPSVARRRTGARRYPRPRFADGVRPSPEQASCRAAV